MNRRRALEPKLFTKDGLEVAVTLTCTACGERKPLVGFGLRRMPDGGVRTIPQCSVCRGPHADTSRYRQAMCGRWFDLGRANPSLIVPEDE